MEEECKKKRIKKFVEVYQALKIKQACKKYGFNFGFTIEQKTITELDLIDDLEMPRYDGPQKLPL